MPTTITGKNDEITAAAERIRSGANPQWSARAAEWVNRRLEYVPGATGVQTSASEAVDHPWTRRLPDFAHATIAVLRGAGIPARYVSGYLHPQPDANVGETVTGKIHAWVEWWADDWWAYDPTNDAVGHWPRHDRSRS